mmetsp:Transcript_88158/g.248026  ORF Transcript_88158/g.248026 Transcript_88158/m.248026 type:complete len:503 (-) Transcript_88158:99-1607(-)
MGAFRAFRRHEGVEARPAMENKLALGAALGTTLLEHGPGWAACGSPMIWPDDAVVATARMSQAASRGMTLLLVFICLAEFLPSEPFLVDFMISKGVSNQQVVDEVFVIWIYWRPFALLFMGVFAECAGCAITLIVGAVFGTITVTMTCLSSTLGALQATQLTVAMSSAAHAGALFALVFELSAMTRASFQLHVHWAKATFLFSNFAAGLVGSSLRCLGTVPYRQLWMVSMCCQLASVVVAGWLAFHIATFEAMRALPALAMAPQDGLWSDVVKSFRLRGVAHWTLWSVSMQAVHTMVATFWQALLRAKTHMRNDLNGFVTSGSFLVSIVAILALADAPALCGPKAGCRIMVASLFASGILVLVMGLSGSACVVYSAYFMYEVLFVVSGTVALQQIGAEVHGAVSARSHLAIVNEVDAPRCAGISSTTGPRRPRLALLLSFNQVLGALAQAAVQCAFAHIHGEAKSGRLTLSARFQILGASLCCAAALLLALKLVPLVRRSVC